MRRRTRQKLILGGGIGGLILALVIALVVVLQVQSARRQAMLDALAAAAAATPAAASAPDPFEDREADAVAQVRGRPAAGVTVGARLDGAWLPQQAELLRLVGASGPTLYGARVHGSVYEVVAEYAAGQLRFGPRWLVQLDPQGMAPAGSGGVVATNALAWLLGRPDSAADRRYMNRSREVVQALTEHRFEGGVRLGAALLTYLHRTESAGTPVDVIGWAVIPEQIDPEGRSVYRAVFQWREGTDSHDAIWNVSYQGGLPSFRPGDQRADDLMRMGETVTSEQILDIRPVSLRDVSRPPSEERDARVRALRYVLADTRIVEAVGALLALRAQGASVEYIQWHSQFVDDTRAAANVEYRFRENGVEQAVGWRVQVDSGARAPTTAIAIRAEQVLALVDVAAPPPADRVVEADAATAAEGSGSPAEGSGTPAAADGGDGG